MKPDLPNETMVFEFFDTYFKKYGRPSSIRAVKNYFQCGRYPFYSKLLNAWKEHKVEEDNRKDPLTAFRNDEIKEAFLESVLNVLGPTLNKVLSDKFKESQAYVEVAEKDRADALKQLDSNEQVIETLRNEIAELKNQIKEYAVEKQKMNDDFTRKLVEQAKELAVLQEKLKSIVIEPVKMSKTK